MRVLPSGWSPSRCDDSFFVVRELWWIHSSSLGSYNRSDNLRICENDVYCGDHKLCFVRNKYNIVYKHFNGLDENFWKLFASHSSVNDNYVYIDAYINLKNVSRAITSGVRFNGREILYSQIFCRVQELRIENYILEIFASNDKRINLKKFFVDAFEYDASYFNKIHRAQGLKTSLYPFQQRSLSRMIELENGVTFQEISDKYTCFALNHTKIWLSKNDVLCNTEECETLTVHFKGGFLTDQMGMGKTLTAIALCSNCPIVSCETSMRPKATLVICPSHLISHWSKEIDKHSALSYVCITVKDHMEKFTVKHIMSGMHDFVLVSFSLFCNPLFRRHMDYYSCSVARRGEAFLTDFRRQAREDQERQIFIPHIFDWGRIIIDEFHELGNACYPRVSTYVASLKSEKTWFVSGTPTVNISLYQDLVPYKMFGKDICKNIPVNDASIKLILSANVKNQSYEDIQIPPIKEQVFKIQLNKSERIIYDGIRSEGREEQLKVCSYARLARCIATETEEVQTIDEMKDLLKHFLENKVRELTQQLDIQNKRIDQLQPLVPDIETRTRESFTLKQYLLSKEKCEKYLDDTKKTFEYVKNAEQIECVICLQEMDSPCVIKSCGHRICASCLPLAIRSNNKCPVCRVQYSLNDVIKVNKHGDHKLLQKYGSKLYNLLLLLKNTPGVKTLIFSQWDELLKDVGKCITSYDDSNKVLFCRGNIMQRKSATDKFSYDDEYNLLLLSTLNVGSGCDLSMARRVILLDTIDASGEYITGIERQAIARCHRIGQTDTVEVVRYIAKDTIEEEIYDRVHTLRQDSPNTTRPQ